MADDDPLRTFTDYSNYPGYGPGIYSPRNPWRAAGAAPVDSPCGGYGGNMHGCKHADGTPAPCVVGGFAYGPDARDSYKQGNLGSNIKRTKWARGSVVEAAYIMYSNHGGGYSYRLCKQSSHLTEECFQAGHLDFVGNEHIIQWGPTNSTRKYIPAVYTTNGTHPKGSMWARGPIPTCAGANGGYTWHSTGAHTGISAIDCEQYPWQPQAPRQTQFPAPLPGLYGWGNDYTDLATHKPGHYMPYFIIDRLQVPVELEAGDYVVSWRWDVEQGAQVWTTCGAIQVVDHPVEAAENAAWDDACAPWPPSAPIGCDICTTVKCAGCKGCTFSKEGSCAPCWAVNSSAGDACLNNDGSACQRCW